MLEGTGLTRTIGDRAILDGVSFQVEEGGIASVLGPSGSGKTTLLRLIMGLEAPDAGDLRLAGQPLSGVGVHVPAEQRGFAMVFQEFTLFPHLDVFENLTFGLDRGTDPGPIVDELLELLEIEPLRRRRIDNLSGGEQQRVALARALAVRPRVLLLDEPFSNIDYMLRDRLYARFKAHLTGNAITTVIATHDHKEAFYFSDHILVLKDGALIDSNSPQLVYQQPRNAWVADFFGESNVIAGLDLAPLTNGLDLATDSTYVLRPEALDIVDPTDAAAGGTVEEATFYGFYQDVRVRLDGGLVLLVRDQGPGGLETGARVGVRLRPGSQPHPVPDPADGTKSKTE